MEWETRTARRDWDESMIQNYKERKECASWKDRFAKE